MKESDQNWKETYQFSVRTLFLGWIKQTQIFVIMFKHTF